MTESELFTHICSMTDQKPKGRQPPLAEVAIPLHPDQPIDYERRRETAVSAVLGPSDFVYHPSVGAPHIDVYRYPPHGERAFTWYITNGMSDFPLQLPDGSYYRAEVMAAVRNQSQEVAEFLHILGQFPFATASFLHYHHTVPVPQGLLPKTFAYAMIIPPFLAPDLTEMPLLSEEPVTLLQAIAITASERDYAAVNGSRKLVNERLPDELSTWLLDGRSEAV